MLVQVVQSCELRRRHAPDDHNVADGLHPQAAPGLLGLPERIEALLQEAPLKTDDDGSGGLCMALATQLYMAEESFKFSRKDDDLAD